MLLLMNLFLELCDFNEIAMNLPLQTKRARGRPKATAPALVRQPEERAPFLETNIQNEVSEHQDEPDLNLEQVVTKKRGPGRPRNDERPTKKAKLVK